LIYTVTIQAHAALLFSPIFTIKTLEEGGLKIYEIPDNTGDLHNQFVKEVEDVKSSLKDRIEETIKAEAGKSDTTKVNGIALKRLHPNHPLLICMIGQGNHLFVWHILICEQFDK
jgi:hypothetical protein